MAGITGVCYHAQHEGVFLFPSVQQFQQNKGTGLERTTELQEEESSLGNHPSLQVFFSPFFASYLNGKNKKGGGNYKCIHFILPWLKISGKN